MPSPRQVAFALSVLLPVALHAQASPYIPLDDPRLPALEHLIARGDIEDPSPFVRPFRRSDAIRVLAAADTTAGDASGAVIRDLLATFRKPEGEAHWRLEPRIGFQSYSSARRDPLHPAGPSGIRPYAELGLELVAGNFALASRPAAEPRLLKDPDWPGRKDVKFTGRQVDAYVSAQFKWARLFYGKLDQNWGPEGVPGIGLSNYSYGREAIGFEIGSRDVHLGAIAAPLQDATDSLGQPIHRYHFAHRLDLRLSRRVHLALWETTILQGLDRQFDARYRNPVTLLLLGNQYGLGEQGSNLLVGVDAQWKVARRVTLQAQLGIDDFQYQDRGGPDRYPDRWAMTIIGFGPLGRRAAWRALYTRASSLALRTQDSLENFTDAGIGIGRNFIDNDQLSVFATLPVWRRWLVAPELTLLRQGEGLLTAPAPPRGPLSGGTPQIFIGVMERTWRAAVGVTGERGILRIGANAGLHHVVNDGHVAGRTRNRFQGSITATIGLVKQGGLK